MQSKMFGKRSAKSTSSISSNLRLFEEFSDSNWKLVPEQRIRLDLAEHKDPNELLDNFRGLLILGRCLGIIPISGVYKRSYFDWKSGWNSLAVLTTFSIFLLLAFNFLISVVNATQRTKHTALDIAEAMGDSTFVFWGLFMYTYFLIYRQEFIKIFEEWSKCNALRYTKRDKTLKRTIVLVSTVMFTSAILENAVLHLEYFPKFDYIHGHELRHGVDRTKNVPQLMTYYMRAHPSWNNCLGYSPIFPVLAGIAHKFILYGGNYVDVLIALLARALYFKFKALNKVGEEILFHWPLLSPYKRATNERQDSNKLATNEIERKAWRQLSKDHESLCDVMKTMTGFLSPIIFVTYTVNIYYVCMQVLYVLRPVADDNSIVHSIYGPWSFVHVVMRIFLYSLCMARVNEQAHETREIVRRCPEEMFTGPIANLDRRLNTGPQLGMHGFNCFTVTKSFMLSLLQVVFTIEIVLVQALTQDEPQKK